MAQPENTKPNTLENIWKSQEEPSMHVTFTPSALDALSRLREKLNQIVFWALSATLAVCAGSASYNIFRVDQPWLRLGQAWALGLFIYLITPTLNRGPSRQSDNEPSGRYLVREHEERGRAYEWVRRRLYLGLPSMAASWWGIQQVNSRGLLWGSWPFLVTGACLVIVWYAFGKAAEKAFREAEEVRRSLESR